MKKQAGFIVCLVFLMFIRGSFASSLNQIIQQAGITGGLVIQLDCGDGELLTDLVSQGSFIGYGLDRDAEDISDARKLAAEKDVHGQVFFSVLKEDQLPFIDNLANLIITEKTDISEAEILRVLCPLGTAIIAGKVITKPWPDDISEWTHYLNRADNNAVAADTRVGPPKHLQFQAHPKWSRHHDKLASISTIVTSRGKLFYIMDEGSVQSPDNPAQWSLAARDAFNGLLLWKQPISSWVSHQRRFRSGPVQLQRLLVTERDRLYVTMGLDEPVSVLDANNGKTLQVLSDTDNAEEILYSKSVLVVVTGVGTAEQTLANLKQKKKNTKVIKAVDTKTGTLLWQYPPQGGCDIHPRTLTVADGAVFAQQDNTAICFDLKSGEQRWQTKALWKSGNDKTRSLGWTFNAFSYSDGVLLCAANNQNLVALDASNGSKLWECPAKSVFGKTPEVEVYVINGVVWSAPDFSVGRDLKTGKELTRNHLQESLITVGHHARCYRGKATERYIIQGYRGLEFRDTQGGDNVRNNWIRGICQYGILPANGLVYIPPHNCGCYFEAKLYGFWGLTAQQSRLDGVTLSPTKQIEKGPAYTRSKGIVTTGPNDWPMYRGNAARSACSSSSIAVAPNKRWEIQLDGQPTPPVIAGDYVACAVPDRNQVVVCSAQTGELLWTFHTPSKVDSAPTFYGENLLFGCRDGYVYCLEVKSGQIAWRFRAAPLDLRTVSLGGVESLWPVHGSILVHKNKAYFVAGRSTYLDGGLFLYALDVNNGQLIHAKRMASKPAKPLEPMRAPTFAVAQNKVDYKTRYAPDQSDAFSMKGGNLSDILSALNGKIYLRHEELDENLQRTGAWTHHLFSTSRFIDDNEAHRSHVLFGRGEHSMVPVAYEWLLRPRNKTKNGLIDVPAGKLLVFDTEHAWSTPAHLEWNNAIKVFDIKGIDTDSIKDFYVGAGQTKQLSPELKEQLVAPNKNLNARDLGEELDFHARALVKAANSVIVGGYPDSETAKRLYDQPTSEKGHLQIMDASNGQVMHRCELPAPPRFDGIAVANRRVFVACEDGKVLCFE